MRNNKKPSWKEKFSNWTPSNFSIELMRLLTMYLCGISTGISVAVIVLKLGGKI